MSDDFSKKIKELRISQKLTLEQVGNIAGVGKSTVRKWENGIIKNLRRDKIALIAKALNTTPAYLMGWEEPETAAFIILTPDPNYQKQKLTAFNKDGIEGAHEIYLPSDDVLNEINKLAQALKPYPAEQINAILKLVENGGNIPLSPSVSPELRELISICSNLTTESLNALITVAKTMKQ